MTFEEFKENCSVDITNVDVIENKATVMVIFSAGSMKDFSLPMLQAHEDFCKDTVMSDLYRYLFNKFKEN